MPIGMETLATQTPERIADFLSGSAEIEFTGQSRAERYPWVEAVLTEQRYFSLSRKQRGAVRALLSQATGLSMP